MSDVQAAVTQPKPSRTSKAYKPSPSRPLPEPRRELFAQAIARGVPVRDAYVQAGYKGEDRSSLHQARWNPAVAARVEWLLSERVNAETRRRHAKENSVEDIRIRAMRRLEAMALGDRRDLIQWGRKPVVNSDGDVTGFVDDLALTPSDKLTADQAALVKGVFMKSGQLRVEMVPQLEALRDLMKSLGMLQDSAPPPPSTVNIGQINVGNDAVEAVRRVAFLLAAADNAPKPLAPLTIEHVPSPEPVPVVEAVMPVKPVRKGKR